jgi:hypothetical protein
MKVFLQKDRQFTAQHFTAPNATVTELTRKLEGHGHKVYTDSFFSSPDLFDDITKKKNITVVGLSDQIGKGMPHDLQHKKMKIEQGDIKVTTRCDLTAIHRMGKRDIYMLMNVHDAPTEGNFCDEQGNTTKSLTVTDYNYHMGCTDETRWSKAIPLLTHMEVDKEIVLPSARSGHSDHK